MTTFRQFFPPPDSLSMVTVEYLGALAEARGKQQLYARQSPQRLKALKEHALVESAISSNRIEGVEVEHSRAITVVFGKPVLRDRPEEEVAGYREGSISFMHQAMSFH